MLYFVQIPSSSPYDLLVRDECTSISPTNEVNGPDPSTVTYPSTVSRSEL